LEKQNQTFSEVFDWFEERNNRNELRTQKMASQDAEDVKLRSDLKFG
jgi:hypothetical protein